MSLLTVPYNRVHAVGDVLFASRGGQIHAFTLSDSKYTASWKHPDVDRAVANADDAVPIEASDAADAPVDDGSEPPAKRQKVEDESQGASSAGKGKRKGKKQGGQGNKHSESSRIKAVPDRSIITLLTSTTDGKHLVAVSGHDKAIWVFAHDGQGNLTQLSKRTMPKRPSSVVVGPDAQILAADKFGDVYALPLIVDPSWSSTMVARPSAAARPLGPSANPLTVHSKRNLEALDNQRKQMEQEKQKRVEGGKDEPAFDHTLLLGHVSMLTSLAVAESDGRRYIITADRDEHIRVSRYLPQAHVIEGYCFGHKEFVSEIAVPLGRGDVLVSGGGDEDVYVWNWKDSVRLSKVNLLALAREITPSTTKVAVSCLTSLVYPSEEGDLTYVLAICEDVKAIFTWQLLDTNELKNPGIIQLPGNPLHIATAAGKDGTPRLVVAMDPLQNPESSSLHAYTLNVTEHRLSSDAELPIQGDDLNGPDMQVSEREVRSLFYTVENLRKQHSAAPGDASADDAVGEAGEEQQTPIE